MERAKTVEQYVGLIDEALDELADVRMSAEYDTESMGSALDYVFSLETQLQSLRRSMQEGAYVFGDEPLPFMALVEKTDDRLLPFKHLLMMINATHTHGLDVDDD